MSVADLANNIEGSLSGLGSLLGFEKEDPGYKKYPNIGVDYDSVKDHRKNWFSMPSTQDSYTFSVQPLGGTTAAPGAGSIFDDFGASLSSFFGDSEIKGFSEFKLPISPQEITQREDFAVGIKPTQGGTVVNHSGNRYKDLVISGTTGIHAFRSMTGVRRSDGKAIFQPDTLKYRSGYEVFRHFRNYIKSYHETKATATPESRDLVMVFKNYKDWEFLIVEPLTFEMKRSASKPLHYDYNIRFRVIGHYDAIKDPGLSFFDYIDAGLDVFSEVLEVGKGIILKKQEIIAATAGIVDGLIENIQILNLALKAATGANYMMSDMLKNIDNNYLSAKDELLLLAKFEKAAKDIDNDTATAEQSGIDMESLPDDLEEIPEIVNEAENDPAADTSATLSLVSGLMGNANTQMDITDYPPAAQDAFSESVEQATLISNEDVENLQQQIIDLSNQLIDAMNQNDATFDEIFGLVSTNTEDVSEITDEQIEILYGLNQLSESINGVLSSDNLFDTLSDISNKSTAQSGSSTIGNGIFSFPNPSTGIQEGILSAGITLEDIALQELGDSSRWTEIAELNGLKAPYIDDENENSKIVSHIVRSKGFSDPGLIGDLRIGYKFIVSPNPTPVSGWLSRENQIAEYLGGVVTTAAHWRFIYPSVGTVVRVLDRSEYYEFDGTDWLFLEDLDVEGDGLLKPGDIIKLPTSVVPDTGARIPGPRDNYVTNDLTSGEKALGVDIKLDDDNDLAVSSTGDLQLGSGYTNGAQAIVLKILYDRGDLKKFKDIGTELGTGTKALSINTIRPQLVSSLLQDSRIQGVRNINIFQDNNTAEVSFVVIFKDIQDPVPVTIPI